MADYVTTAALTALPAVAVAVGAVVMALNARPAVNRGFVAALESGTFVCALIDESCRSIQAGGRGRFADIEDPDCDR